LAKPVNGVASVKKGRGRIKAAHYCVYRHCTLAGILIASMLVKHGMWGC
jgi:hypothetical protein